MVPMTRPLLKSTLLLCALALPAVAAERYVAWPGKDQLRAIQRAAYNCSLENSAQSCDQTRALADPLMDHPRLPGLCKDVVWNLIEQAKVASSNDFRRRDAIDKPARRLSTVCSEPVKKAPKPGPGGPAQQS